MTKYSCETDKKDCQGVSILSDILAVLKKHSLNFSDRGVFLIVKAIKSYQFRTKIPKRPTKLQMQDKLKLVESTATQLSNLLHDLSWHIPLEDPPDSLQLRLESLAMSCRRALTQGNYNNNDGRPQKSAPLVFLVQTLILIFEKETGRKYTQKERSTWARPGEERAIYDPLNQEFIKTILEYVAPDEDPNEVLKAARRPPVSLDWMREMQKKVDEIFKENSDTF